MTWGEAALLVLLWLAAATALPIAIWWLRQSSFAPSQNAILGSIAAVGGVFIATRLIPLATPASLLRAAPTAVLLTAFLLIVSTQRLSAALSWFGQPSVRKRDTRARSTDGKPKR